MNLSVELPPFLWKWEKLCSPPNSQMIFLTCSEDQISPHLMIGPASKDNFWEYVGKFKLGLELVWLYGLLMTSEGRDKALRFLGFWELMCNVGKHLTLDSEISEFEATFGHLQAMWPLPLSPTVFETFALLGKKKLSVQSVLSGYDDKRSPVCKMFVHIVVTNKCKLNYLMKQARNLVSFR